MQRHMLEAIGKYVVINDYVDADYAGNMTNRRSHLGIIIYANNAPIIWYSKLIINLRLQLLDQILLLLGLP